MLKRMLLAITLTFALIVGGGGAATAAPNVSVATNVTASSFLPTAKYCGFLCSAGEYACRAIGACDGKKDPCKVRSTIFRICIG